VQATGKRICFLASFLVLLCGQLAHAQQNSSPETLVSTYPGAAHIISVDEDGTIASVRRPDRLTGIDLGSYGIALGDFDNDGLTDHLIGGRSSAYRQACIEFQKGLETADHFELGEVIFPRDWTTCALVMDFAVADYDGDNNLDFAVNYCWRRVHVFMGNGDGTFEETKVFNLPFQAVGIDAEDLNADGNADFAVVSFNSSAFYYELPLEVFLGDGAGDFSHRTIVLDSPYTNGYPLVRSRGIALADFDNDGATDVVVNCDRADYNDDKMLSFYKGWGDGTFEESPMVSGEMIETRFSTNSVLAAMDAGDFNHDGCVDIIAAHHDRYEAVVYAGTGDGTFTLSSQASVGPWLSGLSTLPFENSNTGPIANAGGPYVCFTKDVLLDVDPDTFNKSANGKWVTAYLRADHEGKCELILDGTNSYDPDGDPLTYLWTVVDETDNELILQDSQPTVELSPGQYSVTLMVNDGSVDSGVSSTTIDVNVLEVSSLLGREIFLNGVPASRSINSESYLVVKFDRKDFGETLQVDRDVRVFLTGSATGEDVIRVIDSSKHGRRK
jgi:hypothetical protein